ATPAISTLSLHDALPISRRGRPIGLESPSGAPRYGDLSSPRRRLLLVVGGRFRQDHLERGRNRLRGDLSVVRSVRLGRKVAIGEDRKSTRLNSSHVAISY